MSEEMIRMLNDLSKRPATSLALNVMELTADNLCKDKEIEELNNIINELEKWLVEWREMLDCPDFYEEGIIDCINDTLTKLQELKGSDSNE